MSHPTDQSTTGSQELMGASNTKSQAPKGPKSEQDYFLSTRYKQLYSYFIVALRNCSEQTREELSDTLEEIDLEDVDVEKECRRLEKKLSKPDQEEPEPQELR